MLLRMVKLMLVIGLGVLLTCPEAVAARRAAPRPAARPRPRPRPAPRRSMARRAGPRPAFRSARRGGRNYNARRNLNNRRGYGNRRAYRNRPRYYRPQTRTVTTNTDYVLTLAEEGKVRVQTPPVAFDDKGNVKKYTAEELQKLKGDDPTEQKLAGYKAEYKDLTTGAPVQVTLTSTKSTKSKIAKTQTTTTGNSVPSSLKGKLTKLNDRGGSKTLTVRVTTTKTQRVNGNYNNQNYNNQNNNNNNQNKNQTTTRTVVVGPEDKQATVVLYERKGEVNLQAATN